LSERNKGEKMSAVRTTGNLKVDVAIISGGELGL